MTLTIDQETWMLRLLKHIMERNYDFETEKALMETYCDFLIWKEAYEEGLTPEEAYDSEISHVEGA